jgi:hypothetical protein
MMQEQVETATVAKYKADLEKIIKHTRKNH